MAIKARRTLWGLLLVAGCFASCDLVAWKSGWVAHPPWILAGLFGILFFVAVLLLGFNLALWGKGRESNSTKTFLQLLFLSGILVLVGGGMCNWLFSLQGAVILTELDAVPLSKSAHLQEYEAGLLSDVDEMRITLQLEHLALLPGAGGTFTPTSHLRLVGDSGLVQIVEVAPDRSANIGTLRLYQGAFGFAPRIVLLRDDKTLFDQSVPFTTERHGLQGLSFQGEFTFEKENLAVSGSVTLENLDERMKGHPTLSLTVRKGDKILGSGDLIPGHFADLQDGYRIGFAGMKKWSEIDLTRKNYPLPIFLGLGMTLLSGLLWPIALWRKW